MRVQSKNWHEIVANSMDTMPRQSLHAGNIASQMGHHIRPLDLDFFRNRQTLNYFPFKTSSFYHCLSSHNILLRPLRSRCVIMQCSDNTCRSDLRQVRKLRRIFRPKPTPTFNHGSHPSQSEWSIEMGKDTQAPLLCAS